MHLSVDELRPDEITAAFILSQRSNPPQPDALAQIMRGQRLIDPDGFAADIQRRYLELMQLGRGNGTSAGKAP